MAEWPKTRCPTHRNIQTKNKKKIKLKLNTTLLLNILIHEYYVVTLVKRTERAKKENDLRQSPGAATITKCKRSIIRRTKRDQ